MIDQQYPIILKTKSTRPDSNPPTEFIGHFLDHWYVYWLRIGQISNKVLNFRVRNWIVNQIKYKKTRVMKKLMLLGLAIIFAVVVQAQNKKGVELTWEKGTHDFGEVV